LSLKQDETCVLCNECYQGSCHDGHEVFFYHSAAGGCCDCGDSEAWSASGFCEKHGKVHADPSCFLPPQMKHAALGLFATVLQSVVEFARLCGDQSSFDLLPNEKYTLYFYSDDFHTANEFQAFYNSVELRNLLNASPEEDFSFLASRGFIKMKSNVEVNELTHLMPYFRNSGGYTVRALTKKDELRYENVLGSINWMESMSLACDGMCRLIGNSINPDFLKQIIFYDMFFDKQFSKAFHNLLLSLMADQPFKMTSGIAYTNAYQTLCKDFAKGHGLTGSTMFNLSVQFLNREVFVHEICYHYSFLDEAIQSLYDIITCLPREPETNYFNQAAISHRRYGAIVGDLKV
jgi:hypothetical protein